MEAKPVTFSCTVCYRYDHSQRGDHQRSMAAGTQHRLSQHHAAERCHPDYRMGGPGQKEVLLPGCVHDLNHQGDRLPCQRHPHSAPGPERHGALFRHHRRFL